MPKYEYEVWNVDGNETLDWLMDKLNVMGDGTWRFHGQIGNRSQFYVFEREVKPVVKRGAK